MKIILLFIIFLFFAGFVNAIYVVDITGRIYSTCLDSISNVTVRACNPNLPYCEETHTDSCGWHSFLSFPFDAPTCDGCFVELSKKGYITQNISIASVVPGSWYCTPGICEGWVSVSRTLKVNTSETRDPYELCQFSGRVEDNATGDGMNNVEVTLSDENGTFIASQLTYSIHDDINNVWLPGYYSLATRAGLMNGTYTLMFNKTGYFPQIITRNFGCTLNWIYLFKENYVNCGLKIYNGTTKINVACEPPYAVNSPLRIFTNNSIYGVALVNTTHRNATNFRIQTPSGVRVLRKL